MLPGWPGMTALRRNSERALYRENPDPKTVVQTFGGSQPQTLEGVMLLARAYVALGNVHGGALGAVAVLAHRKLEAKDEAAIIEEFGSAHPDRRPPLSHGAHVLCRSGEFGAARRRPCRRKAARRRLGRGRSEATRPPPKLLKAVPAAQRSAGYFFAEAEYLRKQGEICRGRCRHAGGADDREALVDPDAWWVERRVLSRELVDQGDMKTAYAIVAAHAAESPANAADAEFHAGWYALRGLNDPKAAATHFSRIAELAEGPISLSRAYYWLGRAAEAGGPGDAKDYFARAVGLWHHLLRPAGRRAHRQADAEHRLSRAMRRRPAELLPAAKPSAPSSGCEDAGYGRFADTLYRDLAGQLTVPGELALLAVMARKADNHFLALKVGKIAAARGIDVGALSHPLGVIPASANISGSGKALAYAIARQESEFNVGAVSGAGARGLLQLMPGTARELAKKAGLPFSQARLTTDAGYNATLGAAFLGEQLGRFNGSYVLTFAGYNAGPSRAAQWVARYGDPRGKDIDAVVDWIERIPYAETRSYVQRVMENYEVYKMRISGKLRHRRRPGERARQLTPDVFSWHRSGRRGRQPTTRRAAFFATTCAAALAGLSLASGSGAGFSFGAEAVRRFRIGDHDDRPRLQHGHATIEVVRGKMRIAHGHRNVWWPSHICTRRMSMPP